MSVAKPVTPGQIEDLGHVGNPSKHKEVDASSADVDLTDSTHLGAPCVAIYVGTTGDLAVTDVWGNSVTYKSVPAGAFVPGLFVAVLHTGTSASNLVAVGK